MIKTRYGGLIFFDSDPDSNCIRIMPRKKLEFFKKKRGKKNEVENNWGWSVITEAARDGLDNESFSLALACETIDAHDQGEEVRSAQ